VILQNLFFRCSPAPANKYLEFYQKNIKWFFGVWVGWGCFLLVWLVLEFNSGPNVNIWATLNFAKLGVSL
jgi:hypothetical protein